MTKNEKYAYLVKTSLEGNNNKYYIMKQISHAEFEAEWGRVGCENPRKQTYPMREWFAKYDEKIKKFYRDTTDLQIKQVVTRTGYKPESHPEVQTLVTRLLTWAKQVAELKFTVITGVTDKQIQSGQQALNDLAKMLVLGVNPFHLNRKYEEYLTMVPRKVADMRALRFEPIRTAEALFEAQKRLGQEQDYLNALASTVNTNAQLTGGGTEDGEDTPWTTMNHLEISPASMDEQIKIKQLMGEKDYNFHSAFKVKHGPTAEAYAARFSQMPHKEQQLLWHGSKNENWSNILTSGLKIRPAGVSTRGSMFGYGMYFANKAKKSLGYSSLEGSYWAHGDQKLAALALFAVHLGKPWYVTNSGMYDYATLCEKGYDSVFAKADHTSLYNDEIVIYQEAQATIAYLVLVK